MVHCTDCKRPTGAWYDSVSDHRPRCRHCNTRHQAGYPPSAEASTELTALAEAMVAELDDVPASMAWLFLRRGLLLAIANPAWATAVLDVEFDGCADAVSAIDARWREWARQRPDIPGRKAS